MALSMESHLGETLRLVRVIYRRPAGAVARKVGISPTLLSQYEHGEKAPAPERALAILTAIATGAVAAEGAV